MYIIKTIKLAFVDDVNYKLLPSLQFIRLRTHMFTVRNIYTSCESSVKIVLL